MKGKRLIDRVDKAMKKTATLSRRAAKLPATERAAFAKAIADVTAKLKGIQEAAEAQRRLASFPEINPEPVMEVDAKGRVHYLNPAARRLFPGLAPAGRKHPWLSGIGKVAAALKKTGRKSIRRELEIDSKWFEQVIFPIRENGRLRIYGRDITERKWAEGSLRESERNYRELVENANSIIIRWAPPGKVTFFNRFAAKFFGYEEDDIIGRDVSILVPGQESSGRDLSRLLESIVTSPEKYASYENENLRRSGERVWVQWTNRALCDRSGNVREILAIGIDVTARKRAERALEASRAELRKAHEELETRVRERTSELRRSESLLRSVLETLPIGVWIADRRGRVIQGNAAGQKIWSGARAVGPERYGEFKGWWADSGKPIAPEEWAAARAVAKGETSINEEVEIECSDGTHKFIFNSALPIRDANGEITGAIIIDQDITQRRAGESKRREQSALLELARDAVIVRDPDFRIIFWNTGARDMYGWTELEAIGQDASILLRARFPESMDEVKRKLYKDGHWEGESVRFRKDGAQIVVESRWAVLPGKDGRTPQAILEISRDATERKRAQDALRTASAYARGLLEASLDPLVTISAEGKITDVNGATEAVTGVPRARLIGSDFSDYFTEPEKARAGYREVFSKGTVKDYPLAIRHVSGKITEVLYNATIYKDESGQVAGVFAAARDVTALRAAEEERLRLATAVEQITEGIAITSLDGRILYANPALAAHHALVPQKIMGRPLSEILLGGADDREVVRKMREALDAGRVWNWRLTRRMRDGQVRELEIAVSPIRDAAGRPIHAIAVERDVTQETILEERVRQWQKMEALGTLAGGIAHDFNNILLPILINTELTLAGEKPDSPTAHRLGQVLEAARRGKDMVKQIITFSRQKEQERRPVEIAPIIRESLKFLRVSLPKTIEVSERIETESGMAVADPTQIHQILMNLGSNAAHAMREKGGALEVGLSAVTLDETAVSRHIDLKPGAYLRLTVRDTGHGMTPEVMSRVFEPFFTTKKQGEGVGMGLAVVHGIVTSHGGSISVASVLGKGTTFTIYLPRIMGAREAKEEPSGSISGGTERILFVDDEDIQVRAMNKLLEHLGYRVVGLSDPKAALELFRRQPDSFDLAIMDQTMPGMAGLALAREILKLRPGLPVILCTGYSESVDEAQALAAGVGAFMLKPFSVREIAQTIRRVLLPGG
ncbi:MAG TPA: PAS domain S-box protein [Terriglobales bacterium]|nr:PAS domain S-box protein [Terriglobales bacterium]